MDEIVAAVQYRDYILIFTRRGVIYKMVMDTFSGTQFTLTVIGTCTQFTLTVIGTLELG